MPGINYKLRDNRIRLTAIYSHVSVISYRVTVILCEMTLLEGYQGRASGHVATPKPRQGGLMPNGRRCQTLSRGVKSVPGRTFRQYAAIIREQFRGIGGPPMGVWTGPVQ